eukprot:UN06948
MEACCELFYRLITTRNTTNQFLDMVSLYHPNLLIDLLYNMITNDQHDFGENDKYEPKITCYLCQRIWLIKSLVLELHICCNKRGEYRDMIDRCLQLLGLLPNKDNSNDTRLIIKLLNSFVTSSYTNVVLPHEKWGVQLSEFEYERSPGNKQFNINKLDRRLKQAQSNGKFERTDDEREKFLYMVLRENQNMYMRWAMTGVHQAWSSLIEIMVLHCSSKYRGFDIVLCDILKNILYKLANRKFQTQLYKNSATHLAPAALTIMKKLRDLLTQSESLIKITDCSEICRDLCASIVNLHQNNIARNNLYGCFLSYFEFCDYRPSYLTAEKQTPTYDDSMVLESIVCEQIRLAVLNQTCIERQSPLIHEVISGDMISQSVLLSTLSCSVMTKIALLERSDSQKNSQNQQWLNCFSRENRLIRLIRGLIIHDHELSDAIKNKGKTNIIYQFEAIMGFLTQIASTKNGCSMLMDCNLFDLWIKASWLESKPHWNLVTQDPTKNMSKGGYLDSAQIHPSERYYQLVNPCLRLIHIMVNVHPNNRALHRHVLELFSKHEDVFTSISRDYNSKRISNLRGIQLLTGIWMKIITGPLNSISNAYLTDKNDDIAYQSMIFKQKKIWLEIFAFYKQMMDKYQSPVEPESHRIDLHPTYAFTGGDDRSDQLKDIAYDIIRNVVLLFRMGTYRDKAYSQNRSILRKEDLIFSLRQYNTDKIRKNTSHVSKDISAIKIQGPQLSDLVSMLQITAEELLALLKEHNELLINQTRIDDCVDKYVPKMRNNQ